MDLSVFQGLLQQLSAAYENLHNQVKHLPGERSLPILSNDGFACKDGFACNVGFAEEATDDDGPRRSLVFKERIAPSSDRRVALGDVDSTMITGRLSGSSVPRTSVITVASDFQRDGSTDRDFVDCGPRLSPRVRRRNSYRGTPYARWRRTTVSLIEKRRRLEVRSFWEEGDNINSIYANDECEISEEDADRDVVRMAWHQSKAQFKRGGSSSLSMFSESLDGWYTERLVMSPLSWKKSVWMMIGALIVFLDFLMLTLTIFGMSLDNNGALAWDFFNCLFWSCDMVLVFMTGVYVHSEVVIHLPTIARHYLTRWFLFDASMLTIQWLLVILDQQMDSAKSVKKLKYVKFLKYFRLLRLAKIEGLVARALEIVNSVHMLSLIKILGHLLLVLIYLHCSATAWHWSSTKLGNSAWAIDADGLDLSNDFPLNYFMALHWTVAQLQGTCDIFPGHTVGERAFATGHLFLSVTVMALLFGNLAALVHRMSEMKSRKEHWVNTARQYLEDHNISTQLSLRVRKQVQWAQVNSTNHEEEEQEVLQLLPFDLRSELLEETHKPIISRHCLFVALWKTHIRSWKRLICDGLAPGMHLPGDFVFNYGHACESMRFVVTGEIQYFRFDEFLESVLKYGGRRIFGRTEPLTIRDLVEAHRARHAVTLGHKATCCEACLWVAWSHCGDAVAVGRASLLTLKFQAFDDVMQLDPATKAAFRANAIRFAQTMSFATKEKANDLTTSTDILELVKAMAAESAEEESKMEDEGWKADFRPGSEIA